MTQLESWFADAEVNLIGIQGLGGVGKSALAAFLYDKYSPNSSVKSELTSPPTPLLTGERSKNNSNSNSNIQTPTVSPISPSLVRKVGEVENLGLSRQLTEETHTPPLRKVGEVENSGLSRQLTEETHTPPLRKVGEVENSGLSRQLTEETLTSSLLRRVGEVENLGLSHQLTEETHTPSLLRRVGEEETLTPSLLKRDGEEETLTPPLLRGVGGIENLGFSHQFWADVSQQPDFTYFAEQVITEFGGKVTETGDINLLINDLLKCLNQQRCLLVVDNLETLLNSNRDWENLAYEQFFSHWLKHGKTSIILITTQEKPKLFQTQSCWYSLQGMKAKEGAFFLQKLGIQGSFSELEAFAKQVDGHPLTLELVAGFLREYCQSELKQAEKLGLEKFEQLIEEAKGLHRHKQDVRLLWILEQHFQRLSPELSSFLVDLSVYRQPFDFQSVRGMLSLDDSVKSLDIQKMLRELFNRSLLLETLDQRYQYPPLVQLYAKAKVTDLSVAHEKAIAYYLLHTKPSPWQTLEDVTEYLEIFYHRCELQLYAQAFDTVYGECDDFLNLRGYYIIRVELYGRLVQEWKPSNHDETWSFAASLNSLGNASDSLGQYQQAIEYHQQSLKIFQDIGDISGIASSLNNLGNVYNSLGKYQQALEYYQQSLKIFQYIGNISGIAKSLNNLGSASRNLGQYQQAIEYHQQSLKISQDIGDISGIAKSLRGLGIASFFLGQYQQAIEYYQQSLKISQDTGDISGIAYSLNNLGTVYDSLGKYQQALEYYQQSLKIFQDIGDISGIAYSLNNLGITSSSLGQYQQAIEYHQQSLKIKQYIGTISGIASSLNNLGSASRKLGQYQQAIEYHQQSLKISQDIGDISGIAKSLNNLGYASDSLGQYPQAIEYHQQSLKIKQDIGDISGIAKSLSNLGIASDSLGQYPQAIEYYHQSLKIFHDIGNRRGEAISWFNLANTLEKLNRAQDAIGAYRNARTLCQAMKLDADIQDCDNAIQKIEANFAKASPPTTRHWLLTAFSFILIPVKKLWGFVRNQFNF